MSSPEDVSLPPSHYVDLSYEFDTQSKIRFSVRASEPIDAHFMRQSEFEKWLNREKFMTFRTARHTKRVCEKTFFVVGRGDYVLLLVNKGRATVTASCTLWYR